jgi:hypothetical protein
MIRRIIFSLVLVAVVSFVSRGASPHLSEVGLGYSATSVNTAIFRANSVTTHEGRQYVAYYDPDGYVTLAVRSLADGDHWQIERSPYRGKVEDAHNVISIGVDGGGYIHAAFDHHGDTLHYCKSVAPGSLQLGELQPMIGTQEEDVTYPEFYNLPNGDLMFAYRSGYSGRGNLVMNRYDCKTGSWQRVQDVLIDGENERNAYWQLCVAGNGDIHLSWVWRETWLVETNHDLCYAKSSDGGQTWTRSDGSSYTLPITIQNAEIAWHIPQNSELINQTSMTTDDFGHPYIATYWRDSLSTVPQYRMVWNDGHAWHSEQVGDRATPFSLAGGGTKAIPISRPCMVSDGSTVSYIFRDIERGSRVSIARKRLAPACCNAETHDAAGQSDVAFWQIKDLTDFSVDEWEPSIDKALWQNEKRLNIYVQRAAQGDGEQVTALPPQPIYILEP